MLSSEPATTSNPDILAPADLIVGEGDGSRRLDCHPVRPERQSGLGPLRHRQQHGLRGTVCGNGADYVGVSGTLNFAPGETTKVVRVQIVDCPVVEGFEAFTSI